VNPNAKATETLGQIVADYTADHRLTVNHQDVSIESAKRSSATLFETRREKTLFVIGAPSVRYGRDHGDHRRSDGRRRHQGRDSSPKA
jgi:hypothetical protein